MLSILAIRAKCQKRDALVLCALAIAIAIDIDIAASFSGSRDAGALWVLVTEKVQNVAGQGRSNDK